MQRAVYIVRDAEVVVREPGTHDGEGLTTANRYFDDVPAAQLEFRKRALHPGASIGDHPMRVDEVYYVLSGTGELAVEGAARAVGPGTAIYMRQGTRIGIRQTGADDLVLIIAYPRDAGAT